jgi:hypothetical protein
MVNAMVLNVWELSNHFLNLVSSFFQKKFPHD